jgi:triosephosphate isomerase
MPRRPFIAGNWKMNMGPVDADRLAVALKPLLVNQTAVDVAVAPPYLSIPAVVSRLKHSGVHVAGQDAHPEPSGAFTACVSAEMLRQAGCTYCLAGHSERRQIFGEGDALINAKVHAIFRAGLLPILCIGETLDQRRAGQLETVVGAQLAGGLAGLQPDQVASVTLAYEPVWAIGTGVTASPEQAQEAHAFIRGWLRERYPAYVADQLRIQYGGSVKPDNAAELLSQPDIDGCLVGGASLKADSFAAIVAAGA